MPGRKRQAKVKDRKPATPKKKYKPAGAMTKGKVGSAYKRTQKKKS